MENLLNFIIKRPKEMPFKEYKEKQRIENKKLKNYLQNGTLVYKSWVSFKNEILGTSSIRTFPPAKVSLVNGEKIYKSIN